MPESDHKAKKRISAVEADDPTVREDIASALTTEAFHLAEIGRVDDAIAAYDQAAALFAADVDPDVRWNAVFALKSKASYLYSLDRIEDAIAAYDHVAALFGDDPDPAMREEAIDALKAKVLWCCLHRVDGAKEAIATYDHVGTRFSKDPSPKVRAAAAGALVSKASLLYRLGRIEDAIAAYDHVAALFRDDPNHGVRSRVLRALHEKPKIDANQKAPSKEGGASTGIRIPHNERLRGDQIDQGSPLGVPSVEDRRGIGGEIRPALDPGNEAASNEGVVSEGVPHKGRSPDDAEWDELLLSRGVTSEEDRRDITRRIQRAVSGQKPEAHLTATAGAPPLPKKAPIQYRKRHKKPELSGLDIVDFLRTVYGPWLNGQLTRRHLAELDPSAATAVANWLRNKSLPTDIQLPTKKEINDSVLENPKRMREVVRLGSAARRRLNHD